MTAEDENGTGTNPKQLAIVEGAIFLGHRQ
jgi:hypothetical protein